MSGERISRDVARADRYGVRVALEAILIEAVTDAMPLREISAVDAEAAVLQRAVDRILKLAGSLEPEPPAQAELGVGDRTL